MIVFLFAGSLMYLNEATLLHNIKVRYSKDRIYVSITCHVNWSDNKYPFKTHKATTKTILFFPYHRKLAGMVPSEG